MRILLDDGDSTTMRAGSAREPSGERARREEERGSGPAGATLGMLLADHEESEHAVARIADHRSVAP